MSKPDDIGQDVWDAAMAAAAELRSAVVWQSNEANEVIAEVLVRTTMAERKRCEMVCIDRSGRHKAAVANYPDDEQSRIACLDSAIGAIDCAAAIRQGSI